MSRYRLIVAAGHYEADSLSALLWEVFKHRIWHLWHDGRWTD